MSNPPDECCTIVRGIHKGTPKGDFVNVNGLETYITKPENPNSGAVIILPDVMGNKAKNVQLLADALAAHGFLTLVTDDVKGDPTPNPRPPDFDFGKWRERHGKETVIPIAKDAVDWIHKNQKDIKKIGAVGYCFGAPGTLALLAKGSHRVDVGCVGHPSFITLKELEDIESPLFIAAAETDAIFPEDLRAKAEATLKEGKKTYSVQLFSGVSHGFCVRGDDEQRIERYGKEAAFDSFVAFMKFHMFE